MEDFNFKELEKKLNIIQYQINDVNNKSRSEQIAKLLVILIQIEKELVTMQNAITKIVSDLQKQKRLTKENLADFAKKHDMLSDMIYKIQKARLQLNFHFM